MLKLFQFVEERFSRARKHQKAEEKPAPTAEEIVEQAQSLLENCSREDARKKWAPEGKKIIGAAIESLQASLDTYRQYNAEFQGSMGCSEEMAARLRPGAKLDLSCVARNVSNLKYRLVSYTYDGPTYPASRRRQPAMRAENT